jgi:cytoplasmic iron level regulating protein YaaA (DUF328/UPF0246 family)
MIVLLSPAKTLDFENPGIDSFSLPTMLDQTERLVNVMQKKSAGKLKKLMNISDQLADLNVIRYKHFEASHTLKNAKQSILSFKGDVYRGLAVEDFNDEDLEFAQARIRILSGLYGVLKPLDLIQPYRLEMGIGLKTTRGKNIYEFWKNRITDSLNNDIEHEKTQCVINLASKEYFSAIKPSKLAGPAYHFHFKEYRNGELKFLSFNAKRARGLMAKYIVKNRIDDPESCKGFNFENYAFDFDLSDEFNWVFTR